MAVFRTDEQHSQMAVPGDSHFLARSDFWKLWAFCASQWKCDCRSVRRSAVDGRVNLLGLGIGPAL